MDTKIRVSGGRRTAPAHRRIRALLVAAPLAVALTAPVSAAASEAPVTLESGTVTPAVITGGDGADATITLSRPAPAPGVAISLYGDTVFGESTGRSVTVPTGARSVSFPFHLAAPKEKRVVPILAQVPGSPVTEVAHVTVLPADPAERAVTWLEFDKRIALDGDTVTGTVSVTNPAPAGGLTVSLFSNTSYSDPSGSVPPYVTVPSGDIKANFPITVRNAGLPGTFRPSADLGTSVVAENLTVVPKALAVGGPLRTGAETTLTVGLGTNLRPFPATVTLKSDTPGVTVPASVVVPARSPGVSVKATVSGSIPAGTRPRITVGWTFGTATNTLYVG